MAREDGPFAEFLSQEAPAPVDGGAGGEIDVGMHLKLLVESHRRQEELLGKVCTPRVGLDAKMGSVAESQSRLEDKWSQLGAGYGANAETAGSPSVSQAAKASTALIRGQMICVPGQTALPVELAGPCTSWSQCSTADSLQGINECVVSQESFERGLDLSDCEEEEDEFSKPTTSPITGKMSAMLTNSAPTPPTPALGPDSNTNTTTSTLTALPYMDTTKTEWQKWQERRDQKRSKDKSSTKLTYGRMLRGEQNMLD
jgi:hypothetical protein